jgi:hypothetical protein
LKGYATTWWRTVRQEEGKNHGYTWEFFKERLEPEFVPRNSDYISKCKLRDLVNATYENLRHYVRRRDPGMEVQTNLAIARQPKLPSCSSKTCSILSNMG